MPTFEKNVCIKFDFWHFESRRRKKFESNFTQMSFSNVGNFLSRVGIFVLCLESNVTQTLFSNVGNFFSLSRKFFPSSRLKMTKGKNFRLKIKKLPTFENNAYVKFDSRQRKKIPTQDKKLPTFENNVCVKFDLRRRKKFPSWNSKNCQHLRITFA